MTLQRVNLAGITSAELLERIERGEPFFVPTLFANITRQLISTLKQKHKINVTTTQQPGGLLVTPERNDA
jgi:hypothetical protein